MEKEKILEMARKENKKSDERDTYITTKAFSYGAIGMAITFIILVGVRMFYKKGGVYDLLAMYESYLAAYYLYKYKMTKQKMDLLCLSCWGLAAVLNLVMYIMRG